MKAATAVALLAAVLLVAAATVVSVRSAEPGSAFTPGGGGVDALVEDARLQGLQVQRSVAGPLGWARDPALIPADVLVVVAAPPRPFTADEARAVQGFVARGGQLLVADDFGQANSLTAGLGMAFERVRLVEPQAGQVTPASLGSRSYGLDLGRATALDLAGAAPQAATVLAWSSNESFLDRDGDGIIGAADPQGPFPLIARAGSGAGTVTAVADVSILSASGADLGQNRAWRQALLADALPDGGTVLVDESQTVADPALHAVGIAVAAGHASPWRDALLVAAGLLLPGLAIPYVRDQWRAHRFRPLRFIRRASLAAAAAGGPDPSDPASAHAPGAAKPHWTRRGAAAVLAAIALALLALAFGSVEAGYAAGALAIAATAAAWPRLPALDVRRQVSADRVEESTEVQVGLEMVARSGGGSDLEFREAIPDEFEVREGTTWFRGKVAARAPLRVAYTVSPALRGPYALGPLQVRAADPLHLHVEERHVGQDSLLQVRPRGESVRKVPFRTRIPTTTLGPHLVNRAGDGSEFHALRTYQVGDSYRSVNWKASARSKELMVNQRVHESMAHLALFLDARAISGAGPASRTPLAAACRATLSVASGALRVRDRIRITVYGDGVHQLPQAPGSRQLHDLTELLASLPAAGDTGFGQAVQETLPSLRPGSPVMLASGLEDDPSLVEGMRALRSRGMLPFVVALQVGTHPVEPEDTEPEPDAEALQAARRKTIAQLQALGVPVFDAVADVPLDYLFRTGGGL